MALPSQLSFAFGSSTPKDGLAPDAPPATRDASNDAPTIVHAEPTTDNSIFRSAQALTSRIAKRFRQPIRLVITDNRRTMVSGRRNGHHLELRLHRMFLNASDNIIDALAEYLLERDRDAGRILDAFIENHRGTISVQRRAAPLQTRGRYHNLQQLFDELASEYFKNELGTLAGVRISWGRRSGRRKQRSIRLGTYTSAEKLIRVHPVLDQSWVPTFYVASVVHHEMLHHLVPPQRSRNRTFYHTPEFRRRERLFRQHQEAERWESKHLDALLRTASSESL